MAHISSITKVENDSDYENCLKELNRFNDGYDIQFVNNAPTRFPCWVMEMFHLTYSDDGIKLVLHLYDEPKVD